MGKTTQNTPFLIRINSSSTRATLYIHDAKSLHSRRNV